MTFSETIIAWKQKLLGSLAFLERTSVPHFVRDYRRLASTLVWAHGYTRAMEIGVGDDFSALGKLELAVLRHLGLKPGQMIMDVGCGSGRLAAALVDFPEIAYHGIDVVPEFLSYARKQSPPHFRYTLVRGLAIPEPDNVADFITLFSVLTHLQHHESYIYLMEAVRVLKPGGCIVLSFLEMTNPNHWPIFLLTVEQTKRQSLPHLNTFIEKSVVEVWASNLGLRLEAIFPSGEPFIPLDHPIVSQSGTTMQNYAGFGQSIAVLRKLQ